MPSPVRSGDLPEWLTAESDRVSDSLVTGQLVYAKTLAEAAVSQAAQNYGLINREHAFALMMLAKTLGELQRHQQALESQIRSPEIMNRCSDRADHRPTAHFQFPINTNGAQKNGCAVRG